MMVADRNRYRWDKEERPAELEHLKRVMSITVYLFICTFLAGTAMYLLVSLFGYYPRFNQ